MNIGVTKQTVSKLEEIVQIKEREINNAQDKMNLLIKQIERKQFSLKAQIVRMREEIRFYKAILEEERKSA